MNRLRTLFALLCLLSVICAQAQHYDTNPTFPYAPTPQEQVLLGTLHQSVRSSTPPAAPVHAIAEFQPMGGVLVAYPMGIPVNLIAELSFITDVFVLVYPASDSLNAHAFFSANGVNTDKVHYWVINHNSYWTRDYGPWFIVDGNHQVGVVDFTYNRPQRPLDDIALIAIADKMDLTRYEMPIVHTGGNYMTDGYGTAASTDLVLEENPTLTAASTQSITHDYMGIDNYMFMDDPLGEYIAHIDCWGKFLDVDKVLIGQVSPSDSRYNDYESVANIFANANSPWGNPYQVFRVQTPGQYLVTPYTNSLILNDHVFVPVTGCAYDNDAIAVYQAAMPGYTIVPILENFSTPWENTDALHCRTHELADKGMLLIRHYPILGMQDLPAVTTVEATIHALSGAPLITDSLRMYYRINQGVWQHTALMHTGEDVFQASFGPLQSNDEVEYYLSAADESGRHEKHPYIGAADPHRFTVNAVGVTDHATAPDDIRAYPNPCDNLCILHANTTIRQITIHDICGRIIFSEHYNENILHINTQNWKPGIYNVTIEDESGKTHFKKIIKR